MAKVTPIASVRTILDAANPAAASASVLALLSTSGVVYVNGSGTDTDRAAALVAARTTARLLTPNGAARSANNRVTVLLPNGGYKFTTTFVMDDEWIDYCAIVPASGGLPEETDNWPVGVSTTPMAMFRPPAVLIYADAAGVTPVEQTARDIRLNGFGIAQIYNDTGYASVGAPTGAPCCAFLFSPTTDNANDKSFYDQMYFWHSTPFHPGDGLIANAHFSTGFSRHVAGTWRNCIDGFSGMRVGLNGHFKATMVDCFVGPYAVGGDADGGSMGPCRLIRVRSIGKLNGGTSGEGSFGGCSQWGIPSTSSAYFEECLAGFGSFNLGFEAAGTYIRCRAKGFSFGSGGHSAVGSNGSFTGYAEDCHGGFRSFSISSNSKITGTLVRCTAESGATEPWFLEGATLRDCRFVMQGTNTDAFTLLDNDSVLTNCEIIVFQGGTGRPVNAATAKNVVLVHCRMNNATNDADGLGANVTNLVSSAGNVVSNSIR